jgi:hypothetical protein
MFSWWARRNDKAPAAQPAARDAQDIVFVGEQHGSAELQLKDRLAQLFERDPHVTAAFLARATIDGQGTVVLALRADGANETALAGQIGAVFAAIFNARAHLDVMFLPDARHAEVSRVCRPFFQRAAA